VMTARGTGAQFSDIALKLGGCHGELSGRPSGQLSLSLARVQPFVCWD
jgi:hypothetical protein